MDVVGSFAKATTEIMNDAEKALELNRQVERQEESSHITYQYTSHTK